MLSIRLIADKVPLLATQVSAKKKTKTVSLMHLAWKEDIMSPSEGKEKVITCLAGAELMTV